jgi:hypothetical protein
VNLKTTVQSLTLQKIRFDFDHVCGVDGDKHKIMKFIEDLAAENCIVLFPRSTSAVRTLSSILTILSVLI